MAADDELVPSQAAAAVILAPALRWIGCLQVLKCFETLAIIAYAKDLAVVLGGEIFTDSSAALGIS